MVPYEMEEQLKNLDVRVNTIAQILPMLATRQDLRDEVATLATKEELRAEVATLATKEELRAEVAKLATKEELRDEVAKLATKAELRAEVAKLATKEELRAEVGKLATRDELRALQDDLHLTTAALQHEMETGFQEAKAYADKLNVVTRDQIRRLDDRMTLVADQMTLVARQMASKEDLRLLHRALSAQIAALGASRSNKKR